ncbi:hypothetical protein [Thermococcus sp.]|uniref:hypothetical protein n=1 Tax=Thermococcus sp. TaxID=35749 RepID=UPI00262282F2|nr:hypothetical protein [Thermococcus sp.]
MIHGAAEDYNRMVIVERTAELELGNYTYETLPDLTVYDITFNITSAGSTLSPPEWAFIYDGTLVDSKVRVSGGKYLLPGEWLTVTVQNVPKDTGVHALVVSTEVGCGLKIKWRWVGNAANGSPRVIGGAWYCPVGG